MANENHWLRERVANYLKDKHKWGEYKIKASWIEFPEHKIITRYSKFHQNYKCWFFGVQNSFYERLQEELAYLYYLAFIFILNNEVKLLLLDSQDAKQLLDKCDYDMAGQRKITFRFNKNGDFIVSKWTTFPLEERLETVCKITNELSERTKIQERNSTISFEDDLSGIFSAIEILKEEINSYQNNIKAVGADAYLKEEFDLAMEIKSKIVQLQQIEEEIKGIAIKLNKLLVGD